MNTIKRSELNILKMISNPDAPHTVLVNGEVLQWVGVGWVNEGTATKEQLDLLPHVIE